VIPGRKSAVPKAACAQANHQARRIGSLKWIGTASKALLALAVLLSISACGTTFNIHPTVIFVGDSVTYFWAQIYNGQAAAFPANNWLDVGVLGLTSHQILGVFNEYVPEVQPPAVHIIAGTNDVYPGWQLSDTSTNIESMVKEAKAHHVAVVIGTIPPWGPEPIAEQADPTPGRFDRIDQLNQWIIQFASQEGVAVADYHSLLAAPNGKNYAPGLSLDGIHPSPEGCALMTVLAEQTLKTVLATPSP
jgi:lysophospholipase L1-like esterase